MYSRHVNVSGRSVLLFNKYTEIEKLKLNYRHQQHLPINFLKCLWSYTDGNSIWKKYLHCSITTMLELLNNFIRTRLTVKSRDCNTLLGKTHTSNPYVRISKLSILCRSFNFNIIGYLCFTSFIDRVAWLYPHHSALIFSFYLTDNKLITPSSIILD